MAMQQLCFDKAVQIGRRVEDPEDDKDLCPPGALIWTAITTPTAMPPCIGIDVQLVHGDMWNHIEQNVMVNIQGNNTVNIFQNETYTVTQNRTTNIVGNYTKTIIGIYNHTTINAHIQLNVAVRNNTFVSPKTETHSSPKCSQEPTSWMESVMSFIGNYVIAFEASFMKIETYVQQVGAVVSKFEMAVIKSEANGIENNAEGGNMAMIGLENKLDAIGSRIQALQPSVGALKGHLVGTTLKTLVLGVNQYI